MSERSSGYGIPGIVAAARARYDARREALLGAGLGAAEADARILEEARADGGVVAEGEHVNLSLWSERFGVPREVLEALALAIHRAEPPPSVREPAFVPVPPEDDDIETPPPAATRRPRVVPSGVQSVR